jgi:membrane protein implicated in regulation of membrane protease activity
MPLVMSEAWAWWVALGIIAAVVEVLSPVFGFILVTLAVIPPALAAGMGMPVWAQFLIFAISLVLSLVFMRPRLIARLAPAPGLSSSSLELVGQRGRVVEPIDPVIGGGRVSVGATDWAATSDAAIEVGHDVVVTRQDGVVLSVKPYESVDTGTGKSSSD